MLPDPKPLVVTKWKDIESRLQHSSSVSFLIPASVCRRLGAPLIKIYQDALSGLPHFLTVECTTNGQAMTCLYNGIQRISYKSPVPTSLSSLAQKKGAQILELSNA